MREVNIVISADVKNPFDVFDAIELKAQIWNEHRTYLTEFYSKISKGSGRDFWNWFTTGQKPKQLLYHTQANVLSQIGMRLQSFQGEEDTYGEESRKYARDMVVKKGIFSENIPFHILSFYLPERFLGRLIFSGQIQKFRWSVQGLLGEFSNREIPEGVKTPTAFVVVDQTSRFAFIPEMGLSSEVSIQRTLRDKFHQTLGGFMSSKVQFTQVSL